MPHFPGTPNITFGSEGSFLNFSGDIHKTKEMTGLHPHSSPTHPPPWGCSEMVNYELLLMNDNKSLISSIVLRNVVFMFYNRNVPYFLFVLPDLLPILNENIFLFLLESFNIACLCEVIAVKHHVPHQTPEIDVEIRFQRFSPT